MHDMLVFGLGLCFRSSGKFYGFSVVSSTSLVVASAVQEVPLNVPTSYWFSASPVT